ncbi:MAG: PQQ-binding-like beta-propeller repeat protein [Planctomycetota bacterium]
MQNHLTYRKCLPIIYVLLVAQATGWAMTADELTGRTGVAGGFCSFPHAVPGDELLAVELAKRPSFVVHFVSQDAALVKLLRAKAESEGILGRSLYVEISGSTPLPYANRMVDVLVASGLRDADLTPELKNEWLRVLAPRRGAALVGRAKAAGDELSLDALKAWTKDIPLANTITDGSGTWAILRTDLPVDSDSWTHRCHGPDNAQVSNDATFQAPFLTQWWGMPRQEGFWGMTVVSGNGRLFSLRSSRSAYESVFLTARSLNNGIVLWQKSLRQAVEKEKVPHGGFISSRSCVVVAGDTLYLAEKDGVLRLNAETGETRDRILGPKPGGQIKWLVVVDGMLAVVAGDADIIKPLAYQTVASNPVGRELAVYDTASKKELWRDTVAGDIDERMIAVRGKRLYCIVQDVGLVCRELDTGKIVWTNADPEIKTDFRLPTDFKVLGGLLASQPALMALNDVILLRAQWAKNLIALSPVDGSILWKKPSLPTGGRRDGSFQRSLTGVAVGNLWFYGKRPIDIKTGNDIKGPRFTSSGCGPTFSTPKYLITCWGKVMSLASARFLRDTDTKSPCDIGSLVSEGLLISSPSECGCNTEIKGYRALASAGSIQPHTAPPWNDRLTVLNRDEPAALAVTDADWLTYRHDSRRSGATTASVGGQPKVLWQWKPAGAIPYSNVWNVDNGPRLAPDFLATAAIAAGGFVWFASHDGIIRCMRADSGKEIWTFATGSILFAPPTVWNGRLLAGGGDGRIYCLDATTGRLLWQFAAAPCDRRIFWFGHLISTWPVVSGVVVQDGMAYAVAGYRKENGIHAYALDPKTGQVAWEKDNAGTDPWTSLGSLGHCAAAGGRLWLSSAPSGFFDLKTGDWKALSGYQYGCEVGVLDKWVFQGGRRLSETQDTLNRPFDSANFLAVDADQQSVRFKLNETGTSLPVWDSELAVMPPKALSGGLTAVPTAKLLTWLAGKFPVEPDPKKIPSPSIIDWSELKSWTTESVLPIAVALAKDRVIVACSDGGKNKLVAFKRDDGTKDWSVDLPEQPVMNRIALDRDGRIFVALCDGSMLCLGK